MRHAAKRVIRVQLLVVALSAGVVLAASQPPSGDDAPELELAARASGKLSARVLHVSDGVGFQLSRLLPGDSGTGTVVLGNDGQGKTAWSLVPQAPVDSPGAFGGKLSSKLELTVREMVDGAPGRLLFAGALGDFTTEAVVGDIAPGAKRTLRFDVAWPDGGAPRTPVGGDNAFAGGRADVVYRFRVVRETPPAQQAPAVEPVLVPLQGPVRRIAASRNCVSRRRFGIRLLTPRGFRVRSARLLVNGKRVRVRFRTGRWRAVVDLRRMLRKRVKLEIAVRGADGRTLTGTRTYNTCKLKRTKRRPPKL